MYSTEEDKSNKYFFQGMFNPNVLKDEIIKEYDLIYVESSGFYRFGQYWKTISEQEIKQICQSKLGYSARSGRIDGVVNLLKAKVFIHPELINHNRNRLVLKNGTLDLSNWANPVFHENTFYREDYSTIQLNCNYDKKAECNEFQHFLSTTFESDKDRINLVCEIIGYCLTPSTIFQKAIILYGEGSNGKSVLLNTIENLLTTKNISSVSMNDLDKPFSRGALQNKLLNISSEQEGYISDTAYFKKVVAGDTIDAQFKFKDQFEFRPFCKMLFAMNRLPATKDRTEGFYRRCLIIPFNRIFKEYEQDKQLEEKLSKELDGILLMALEGLKRLAYNAGFTKSKKSEDVLNEYKYDNDPVEQFCAEHIELDKDGRVSVDELYSAYKNFCEESNIGKLTKNNFGKVLKKKFRDNIERKYETIKELRIRQYVYTGIKLMC